MKKKKKRKKSVIVSFLFFLGIPGSSPILTLQLVSPPAQVGCIKMGEATRSRWLSVSQRSVHTMLMKLVMQVRAL